MEKLKKTARGLDVFFKIQLWLLVILSVIMAVSTAALCIKGAGDMSSDLASMQLSVNGILIEPGTALSDAACKNILISTLFHFLILFAFICYGIFIIRRMLSPMKEGKPFNTNVSRDFKKLGWLTILFGIIYNVFDYTVTKNLVKFVPDTVTLTVSHTYNLNFVLIAFAFLLLSYIFNYGEELQRLSDETL